MQTAAHGRRPFWTGAAPTPRSQLLDWSLPLGRHGGPEFFRRSGEHGPRCLAVDHRTLLDDLRLAHHLADVAAGIALRHFAPSVATQEKADGSPVTVADLEIDAAIVTALRTERTDDAILSEESGPTGSGRRRWIIDPLDGTVFFARGDRGWGTYVALEVDGELVLGVINHPLDCRRYWGVRDDGAWSATTTDGIVAGQPQEVRLAGVGRLVDARYMAWPPLKSQAEATLADVATAVEPSVDFLADLLEGRIDVLLSQGGEVWDHAAEVAVVEAAGGRFRDPVGGHRLDLRGGTYTNAALEGEVGAVLGRF